MALTVEAFRKRSGRPGLPCPVATVLEALTEKDRQVLQGALDAPISEVGHKRIRQVLADDGHLEGINPRAFDLAVGKHRRKDCRCAA